MNNNEDEKPIANFIVFIFYLVSKSFFNVGYRINQVRLWECKDQSKWAIFTMNNIVIRPQSILNRSHL